MSRVMAIDFIKYQEIILANVQIKNKREML